VEVFSLRRCSGLADVPRTVATLQHLRKTESEHRKVDYLTWGSIRTVAAQRTVGHEPASVGSWMRIPIYCVEGDTLH